jgi:prolyl-tRNA synthetase
MKQSQFFAPTLRQVKSDNEGHALLLRGGFVRQLSAGIYSYLPLGTRVLRKIENIVREEMNRAGAIELHMPIVHPVDLWAETGRDKMDILFRLKDRKKTDYILGPTHEEVVTDIVRGGISSYKQLPVNLYQIGVKMRDEERPRAGLLRGREFVMKDAYSFDRDIAGLDESFDKMVAAYERIFERCGLDTVKVQASGGGIGGFDTQEFMAVSPSGEDTILFNTQDGYAANLEMATSVLEPVAAREDIAGEIEEFATPGIVTIEALTTFEGGAAAEHQIKTLVYIADGAPVLALLRGDHQLHEAKLASATGAGQLRAANPDEIFELLGAHPGSLGALGVAKEGLQVLADEALRGRARMTTGANKDGFHLRGVDVARDIAGARFVDLREAREGEASPKGGGALQSAKCIELGHVFKLGSKYSKSMNATFLDANGKAQVFEMGCYGIGVSRIMATLAETHRDEKGLVWPESVSPFDVHLVQLDLNDEMDAIAQKIYDGLRAKGVDVLWDDRKERPGAKFADADLFGVPTHIVIGKVTKESGQVELKNRRDKSAETLSPEDVIARF